MQPTGSGEMEPRGKVKRIQQKREVRRRVFRRAFLE